MTVTFLADQLGAGAGGGRFTTNYLRNLLQDEAAMSEIGVLWILATQHESPNSLHTLPPNATFLRRLFPSRLRHTPLASAFGRILPHAQIAHGPFYYAFPGQAAKCLVTVHDLSVFNERFHPEAKRRAQMKHLSSVVRRADLVVCDSEAILSECCRQWPEVRHKFVRVYLGTGPQWYDPADSLPRLQSQRPYLLAVGTLEPRKNYSRLLDAFGVLLREIGEGSVDLLIVGRAGWMYEEVVSRLSRGEFGQSVRWLPAVTDAELSELYAGAAVFTYLSTYEGFGYPPFEAAYAGVPMVLSRSSSVGEIWDGHACCVDPGDIRGILAGWRWALQLNSPARIEVAARQAERAAQFSWKRCVVDYVRLYRQLFSSRW